MQQINRAKLSHPLQGVGGGGGAWYQTGFILLLFNVMQKKASI